MSLNIRNGGISLAEEDEFEIITPTEIDASVDHSNKVRKLCVCGCGEEVTGNRALKRGHTMGEGLSPSVFGGNDILVFQAAFVTLVGAITFGMENWFGIPRTEPEESKAIGEPLGRIAARHIPKAILKRLKPGDAADAIAIITVTSAYVIRITSTKKETPTVAANGYNADQTILGQYAYRPPEQTIQQENGGTH